MDAAATGATFSSLPTKGHAKTYYSAAAAALRNGERAPACVCESTFIFLHMQTRNTPAAETYLVLTFSYRITLRGRYTRSAQLGPLLLREHFSNNNFYSHNGTKKVGRLLASSLLVSNSLFCGSSRVIRAQYTHGLYLAQPLQRHLEIAKRYITWIHRAAFLFLLPRLDNLFHSL